jgi:hypothetical protein
LFFDDFLFVGPQRHAIAPDRAEDGPIVIHQESESVRLDQFADFSRVRGGGAANVGPRQVDHSCFDFFVCRGAVVSVVCIAIEVE